MNATKTLPAILTANTYFWKPSQYASGRRSNEIKRLNEIANFFESLGFEVENTDRVIATKDNVKVVFEYSESCNNVYKRLAVFKNEKVSNITALKKYL